MSLVGLNPSRVALMEMVTKPNGSAQEPKIFIAKLRSVARYRGTSSAAEFSVSARALAILLRGTRAGSRPVG
jgi:Asp-tRNA(Asn)/Glu-tRNA(Gln) amidotransferase B subunit